VRGTKLVLVCAGAFGSPGILERSGIGAKDVLERVGVKQRVDLPGVGENYLGLFVQPRCSSFVSNVCFAWTYRSQYPPYYIHCCR
jgi:choline dehydrogenase-like flavoprotein